MSSVEPFVMFPKKIMFRTELSIHTRFLYTLLQHHDRGNGCWASRDRMSNETGLSLYHIRKGLQELEDVGMIKWKRRGQGKTDFIELINTVDEVDEVEEEVGETISSLEIKSVNPIHYEEEVTERDIDDTPSEIVSNGIECEEDVSLYEEEETLIRSITTTSRGNEIPLIPDGVVTSSTFTQVTLFIPSDFIRDFVRDNYLPLIENLLGKKVEIVNRM